MDERGRVKDEVGAAPREDLAREMCLETRHDLVLPAHVEDATALCELDRLLPLGKVDRRKLGLVRPFEMRERRQDQP